MRRKNITSARRIGCIIPIHIHFNFKSKAHFYCLTEQDVLAKLVELFTTTNELDKFFNIHKD